MVARALSTTFQTILSDPFRFIPLYMVEAEFPGGVVHYSQSPWTFSWGGHSWVGAGPDLLGIGELSDQMSADSQTLEVFLSGIDPTTVSEARSQNPTFRPLTIYLGAFDKAATPWALVPDPYPWYSGLMSSVVLREERHPRSPLGSIVTYVVRCESETIRQGEVSPRLRTHQHHREAHPGDTFHQYATQLADSSGVSPGPDYEPRKLYD